MAEKSQALKYILIGVAITVGVGVCGVGSCIALVGGGAFWAYSELDAPAEQVRLFIQELAAGKLDAARERTSTRFRALHTLADFEKIVRQHPSLMTGTDVTLPRRGISNGRAQLAGEILTRDGTTGLECELVEEGQAWHIDSFARGWNAAGVSARHDPDEGRSAGLTRFPVVA